MSWIFQGNPNRFDIDDYLSRYSFIYWSTPTNQKEIEIGERVFIWRAGTQAGLIAIGTIKELPISRKDVKIPEALGDDLWVSQKDEPSETKVGIEIEEFRTSEDEGFISRETLKEHPILRKNRIITNPVGTVFRVSEEEELALLTLWGVVQTGYKFPIAVTEGSKQLVSHFRRERSAKLISTKKYVFIQKNGKLFCEICGFSFEVTYPAKLGLGYMEAHHKVPLSKIDSLVRTTLDDLLMVCSNCHRMIHRTKECEENLENLLTHFNKK